MLINTRRARRLAALVTAVSAVAITSNVLAQTWDGGGANNNWNTAGNWNPDSVPLSGDTVTFNAAGLAVRQPTISATGSVTGITLDATPTFTLTNYNGDFNVTGAVTGTGGLIVTSSASNNFGRLIFTNTSSDFGGGLTVKGTGIARYNPGSTINTTFGAGDITLDGGTFSLQGTVIANSTSTGMPTGGGGADRNLLNTIVVTTNGGTLNMNQGSANSGFGLAFNDVRLGGTLTTSSSGGGNAGGYTIAGTVTLQQDVARTLRITNATSHNGSDWIAGAIVDGSGSAGNFLRIAVTGRTLQISNAGNSYSGGTIVEAGGNNQHQLDVTATGVLGTGNLSVESGGRVRLLNPTVLATAGNLAVNATINATAGSAVGVGTNTNIADRFTASSAGVYGIDGSTAHSYALDMSMLGNGQMFLGSVAGGTYSGTNLTPGTGNKYRLGGGNASGASPMANLLITGTNALTGNNDLLVGSGLNSNASYGRVIIGAQQDFVGSITVNTDGLLATRLNGGTPFGAATNKIDVFGTLAATGSGGVFSSGVINNTVFHPGSTLEFNNLPDYNNATGGNNADRWDDTKGVTLNGSTVLLFGARGADSTESIGGVTFNGNAQVQTRRNGTSGQDVGLTLDSVARVERGVLRINPGTAANLGADVNNASERVVVTNIAGLNIANGMVAPHIVDSAGNHFLRYDSSTGVNFAGTIGLRPVAYTSTNLNAAGALDIVDQSGSVSLGTNPSVYALRYNDTISVTSGNDTITVGSGGVLAVGNNKTNNAIMTSGATEFIYWAVGGTQTFANNAAIQTSGGFTKAGGSTLNLNNSNAGANYNITGGIVIQDGTIVSGSRFVLALDDNNLTVNHDGRLSLNNLDTTILGLSGKGVGGNVFNGGANQRALTIDLASGTQTYEGRLQGGNIAANLALIKKGAGTQVLSGTNNYSGYTAIDAGTLRLDASAAAGGGIYYVGNGGTTGTAASLLLGSSGVSISPEIVINPGDGSNRTIGGTNTTGTNTFSGPIKMDGFFGENRSLTLTAAAGGTVVLSGTVSGPGQNLIKSGDGTAILSGSSNYTGLTTVSAGTLLVNGSLSSSATGVSVSGGATLGGTGTINRPVNVSANGTISPGTSIGTLTTGDLTLAGTYAVEIDWNNNLSAQPSADQLVVNGTVTLSGELELVFINTGVGAVTPNRTIVLIRNDGSDAVSGTFASISPALSPLLAYTISYTHDADNDGFNNDVAITFSAVPEPASLGLLAMASVGLLRRRRA